jgi:curved DNA-binding protein CbpA
MPRKPFQDHYKVLRVEPTASATEIRSAYRKLAKQLHPDLLPSHDEEPIKAVKDAYDILGDQNKKEKYDVNYRVEQTRAFRAPSGAKAKSYGDRVRSQGTPRPQPTAQHTPPPPPPTWRTPPHQPPEHAATPPRWQASPGPTSTNKPPPTKSSSPAPAPRSTSAPPPSHPAAFRSSTKDAGELIASGIGVFLWWFFFTEGFNGFQAWWNPIAWIAVVGWFFYAFTS